jgi:putative ABC transport system permease protein
MQAASFLDFQDYVKLSHTLESAAYYRYFSANIAGPEEAERIWGLRATASLFETLKRTPALGRVFTADESNPGANPVVVISDGLWKRQFSKDPNVLGRTLSINHIPHTVIGVMPADFAFPEGRYQLWFPL